MKYILKFYLAYITSQIKLEFKKNMKKNMKESDMKKIIWIILKTFYTVLKNTIIDYNLIYILSLL